MVLYRFAKGAKDNPLIGQGILEGGFHRYTVHHRINSHSGQLFLLFKWNPEFIKCVDQFGIHIIHTLIFGALLGSCIIDNILIVNFRDPQVCPFWHLHFLPVPEGL